MDAIPVTIARSQLPELLDRAQTEAITLSRHGKRAGVLVSPGAYDRMCAALEDAEDTAAFDAAMADEDPNIPWEEVKADLGLL